jgi:putative ABC transport system ATP-binding protein
MLLQVERASKIYSSGDKDLCVLDGVSIELRAGSVTGIVGPSGSGKTTLLMIAGLLETPTLGRVVFDGKVVSQANISPNSLRDFRRRHFGFVFQKANLIPFLTAIENVTLAMEINGMPVAKARRKAVDLLEQFGLVNRANNLPAQLSGGEQQRISIARALANEPAVILADEPTAALDGERGLQILHLLRTFADERKVAVCIVTHDPRWSSFFDKTVQLRDGSISP